MKLLILGSGTGVPTSKRYSPGMLLSDNGYLVLIDPSAGTQKRLLEEGVDSRRIDLILVSHFHIDHCGDIFPLLFGWRSDVLPRRRPLILLGPPGLVAWYRMISQAYELDFSSHRYRRTIIEIKPGRTRRFGSLAFSAYRVRHTPHSIGFRIRNRRGKVVSYTGDTDYDPSIIPLCCKADLLVTESSFPDRMKSPGHLTPSLAGQLAAASKCRKVLLTHFYPVVDTGKVVPHVRKHYHGTIILARDGLSVTV